MVSRQTLSKQPPETSSKQANGARKAPPIHVESLTKSFGKQTVLKGINLEVAQGETLSVLGRSGTGKSVLLKLLIGVRQLLARVGMEKDAHKLPAELSGGMQKRVGLARALALEPEILLFDEPTAGLDPITAAETDDLILRLQKERHMASVVVTHDIHGARAVSDRLALLRDGEILIEGTFADLQKSRDPFVMQFLHGS